MDRPSTKTPLTAEQRDFVEQNLGLAREFSAHYSGMQVSCRWLDRDDVYVVATLGIMRAAQLFDPGRGVEFGTYAWRWMRSTVQRWRRTQWIIPIPDNLHKKEKRLPTYRVDAARKIRDADVYQILPWSEIYTSEATADEQAERIADRETLEAAIASLPPLDRDAVLSLDTALGSESLVDFGKRHGFSKEWARRIRERALIRIHKEIGRKSLNIYA
jgi:RNA polymerase sigma factor (sigma-70 family)